MVTLGHPPRSGLARALALAALALMTYSCSTTSGGHGLHAADMNTAVAPGDDLFLYANGGWLKRNPVPEEYPSWGVFQELTERNRKILHGILERAAERSAAGTAESEIERKLGDFFTTGMDVDAIEAQGARPLAAELERIAQMRSNGDLPGTLAHLHRVGVEAGFGMGTEADLEDSKRVITWLTQGGLGLPDRDYYTRDGEADVRLREQYVEHVANMFAALGDAPAAARAAAESVLAFETRLAAQQLTRVESRDPQNMLGKRTLQEVERLTPNFSWRGFFAGCGLPVPARVNMPAPAFWAEFDRMVADEPIETWKQYLRWHVVHALANTLSSEFDREHFRFYGTVLQGTPKQQERWKRVLGQTGAAMGEALGQLYVAEAFPPEAKARCEAMVRDVLEAFRARLESVEWMGAETRRQALTKLAAFRYKLGYPDEWRDWDGLEIERDSYAANVLRANAFDFEYQMRKAGKPVDPAEWGMPPQMVNAYYHPLRNEIVFPAAILQPPFFDAEADDAVNYGAMGAVIGHEITHGFDDQGSQFDAAGNLSNWWSEEDRAEFDRRAAVLVEQFNAYEVEDGLHVNGELTLGENIADLGGLSIAYQALQKALAKSGDRRKIGGLTPEQRFFVSWATAWRNNSRPEFLRQMVHTNAHAPARFRAIAAPGNLPEFQAAFGLDDSSPMVRSAAARAKVW